VVLERAGGVRVPGRARVIHPDVKELLEANKVATPWSPCLHRTVGTARCIRCCKWVDDVQERLLAMYREPVEGEPGWGR